MDRIKKACSILLVLMMLCSSWTAFGLTESEALDEQVEKETQATEETIDTPAASRDETAQLDIGSSDVENTENSDDYTPEEREVIDEEGAPDNIAALDVNDDKDAGSMTGYIEEEFSGCLSGDELDNL